MSDIYVPIDYSDAKSEVPPNEAIIYSTLCNCTGIVEKFRYTQFTKWTSHVLLTENGAAYTDKLFKKKETLQTEYKRWEWVDRLLLKGGTGFVLGAIEFKLTRDPNFETKERFEERKKEFLIKFAPLIIEKIENMLELGYDHPELNWRKPGSGIKFLLKSRQRHLKIIKGHYKRFYSKYQNDLQKEQKRKAKEAQKGN